MAGGAPDWHAAARGPRRLLLHQQDRLRRSQWYRYHTLFAAAMQHEAQRRPGEEHLRALSHRASRWYAQHGWLTEAVETGLAAQDFHTPPRSSNAAAPALIQNEYHTLRRWLERLPAAVLHAHPPLCGGPRTMRPNSVRCWPLAGKLHAASQTFTQTRALWQATRNAYRTLAITLALGEVCTRQGSCTRRRSCTGRGSPKWNRHR
ncbi:MAG TPA: hypothetical protein VIH59_26085 [Candidatus Tectomicrobia bacterium]|jgi:hypothetical protein